MVTTAGATWSTTSAYERIGPEMFTDPEGIWRGGAFPALLDCVWHDTKSNEPKHTAPKRIMPYA